MYKRHSGIRDWPQAFRCLWYVIAASCLTAAVATLSACGYHVTGQSALPGNVRTIGIKMLTNRSIETGVEAIVTNALSGELNRRRPGTIERVSRADAVMSGVIVSVGRETVSRSGTLTAVQRRLTLKVSLTLKDRSGKVLWVRSPMTAKEDYAVVGDNNMATENNRSVALLEASQRLAEDVYRALTDAF